jgi:hypothetical protein
MPRKSGYEMLKTFMLTLHEENKSDIKDLRQDVQQIKHNDLKHLNDEVIKINTRNKVYALVFGSLISLASLLIMAVKVFM